MGMWGPPLVDHWAPWRWRGVSSRGAGEGQSARAGGVVHGGSGGRVLAAGSQPPSFPSKHLTLLSRLRRESGEASNYNGSISCRSGAWLPIADRAWLVGGWWPPAGGGWPLLAGFSTLLSVWLLDDFPVKTISKLRIDNNGRLWHHVPPEGVVLGYLLASIAS